MSLTEYKWRAKTAFEYADTNQIGSLTKHQYKVAMTAVFGRCPDKFEVNRVIESCGGERITYNIFEYWTLKKRSSHSDVIDFEILFALLDKNCNGYLTLDDLCKVGKTVNLRTSTSVWQKVFYSLDKRRKGYLDLYEFLRSLTGTINKR